MDDKTLIQAVVDFFPDLTWPEQELLVDFFPKDDKIKLKKIIREFKQVDTFDTVQELERAIDGDKYFFDEDYDRILDYLRKLHNSDIPRSDLMDFELILHKMRKDHYQVLIIHNRLKDIEVEEKFAERVKSL